MIVSKPYDRNRAVEYARTWALSRNPLFYDFTGGGGNCTNFVSQCLLAGSLNANLSQPFGWYYESIDDRAPAWTGVREFYEYLCGLDDFLPKSERKGPFGSEVAREKVEIGDVIQLGNSRGIFYHTLIITGFNNGEILISAQSNDALDRPLSTYNYASARFLHIDGVNIDIVDNENYFDNLISGASLPPLSTQYIQN